MSDRENPERAIPNDEGDVIGKYTEIDAAIVARSQMVSLGMIRNPQDAPIHLVLEPPPHTGAGYFVVVNRIEELALRLLDETDGHGARRLSATRITSS